MNIKKVLVFILIFYCGFVCNQVAYAQKQKTDSATVARKNIESQRKAEIEAKEKAAKQRQKEQDALRKAQQASRDSAAKAKANENTQRQAAQKRYTDSVKKIREKATESTLKMRKRRADSVAAIRKYKESKKYQDSVAKARLAKTKAAQAIRQVAIDSAKAARKKMVDSAIAVRKVSIDSIRAIQKKRTDSLAIRTKYRQSKRFADSVAVVKRMRTDSMAAKRKLFSDSLASKRKRLTDSLAGQRKAKTDSLAAVRKKRTDSLAAIKKVRTDSLAKVKEKRANNQKAKETEKEKKQQLAFELKIKKKQKAYSNEKMLKKRWSIPRQIVQNTFTHYNYYFNADRKMDEALQNMQRVRKDNYDSLLALFPFNPDRDSATLAPDMDSIIYKASLGIQIHDPRTKWGDDLYLLLGQAYFYKGNYNEASASFRYILSLRDKRKKKLNDNSSGYTKKDGKELSIAQKEKNGMLDFLKHRSVHNESLLWLSRTYTQMKQEGNAESVLDLLETDPNFPKDLQGRLALEKAFIYLNQNDQKAAAEELAIVAADNNLPNWVRLRSAYIAGQIQQNRGEYTASANSFKKVIDLNPKIDMDFYARKNLAYSLMYAGGEQEEAITALKKVLKDGKYVPYYEQVYYVLGRLSANGGKYDEAISYLNEGLRSSKSTPKQKVLSFATLGGVYYNTGRYVEAKAAYDSAALLSGVLPNDTLVLTAVKRSVALGSITGPLAQIHMYDSLLTLAMMPEKDMRAEIRKYIRKLQQAKADSAFKAEQATTAGSATNNTSSGTNGSNPYANWYFSKPALVQQGINDFKRKWGNRTLADNWRRSGASSSGNSANQPGGVIAENENNVELDENGIPTEEALLVFIPRTQEGMDEARMLIRRAYMDAANAYIKDLEDYPPALKTMDTLDKRFPNHEHKAEEAYLRYLVNVRQNKTPEAKIYADELLLKYADTKWAALVRPTESNGSAASDKDVVTFYEETYDMVLQRQCETALARVQLSKTIYNNPRYTKRFIILEGISLSCVGKYNEADSLIRTFISANPTDSLRPWADAILKYIQNNRPATSAMTAQGAAAASSAPPASAPATPNAATALPTAPPPPLPDGVNDVAAASIPASYTYKPAEEHFVLFVFGAMEARASGVKAAMTDFNTFKFNELKLNTEIQVLQAQQGIVAVRSFRNVAASKIYVNSLKSTSQIFREYKPTEYQIILISAANYAKLLTDKDMKPYLQFYNSNYK